MMRLACMEVTQQVLDGEHGVEGDVEVHGVEAVGSVFTSRRVDVRGRAESRGTRCMQRRRHRARASAGAEGGKERGGCAQRMCGYTSAWGGEGEVVNE